MLKEALIKSFDELRTNGKLLIPFVVSLSNHERNQLNQSFLKRCVGRIYPQAFQEAFLSGVHAALPSLSGEQIC
jgi:hypothetical protein